MKRFSTWETLLFILLLFLILYFHFLYMTRIIIDIFDTREFVNFIY